MPTREERAATAIEDGSTVGLVLAEVRDCAPVTVTQVASGVGLPESTVRRALTKLEEAGLIESSSYQRRARVFLPTEGGI